MGNPKRDIDPPYFPMTLVGRAILRGKSTPKKLAPPGELPKTFPLYDWQELAAAAIRDAKKNG